MDRNITTSNIELPFCTKYYTFTYNVGKSISTIEVTVDFEKLERQRKTREFNEWLKRKE